MKIAGWLLVLLVVSARGAAYGYSGDLVKVVIKYVNFSVITDHRVDCESYEKAFVYKTLEITDSLSLSTFARLMHEFRIDTVGGCTVDSRAKIIVNYRTRQKDTICISKGDICLNGLPVVFDTRFVLFLKRLLKRHDKTFHW